MDPLNLNLEFLPHWAKEPALSPTPALEKEEDSPLEGRTKKAHSKRDSSRFESDRQREGDSRRRRGRGESARGDRNQKSKGLRSQKTPFISSVEISFLPEPKALQSVIDQIRDSGRAYPLLGLAKMFLDRPERCNVRIRVSKKASQKDSASLYQCPTCHIVVTSEAEMTHHALSAHREKYYKSEKVQTEAPKGNFVAVARCELNGQILGPPNHHAYQTNLLQLYKGQFQHLSFDRFKKSIVTLRDPEIVKKWQEESSWKTAYEPLSLSEDTSETQKLNSEGEVSLHFKTHYLAQASMSGPEWVISGEVSRKCKDEQVASALRHQFDAEVRFPINVANRLREAFVKGGLHLFKGHRGIQFVNIAHPQALVSDANLISDTVRVILEFLKEHPRADRKALSEGVHSRIEELLGPISVPTSPESLNVSKGSHPSPVSQRLTEDLHWLIRQGHVIEYHLGNLELVKEFPAKKASENKIITESQTASCEKPLVSAAGEEAKPRWELPPPPPLPQLQSNPHEPSSA